MQDKDALELKIALADADISASAKVVFCEMINRSNKDKECVVSISELSRQCRYCERTVHSKIKELMLRGWLIKEEQFDVKGLQISNRYTLQKPILEVKSRVVCQPTQFDAMMRTEDIEPSIKAAKLNKSEKAILVTLLQYRKGGDDFSPTISELAKACGYSTSMVRVSINRLVQKGWLIKKERFRENGSQYANSYQIILPQDD